MDAEAQIACLARVIAAGVPRAGHSRNFEDVADWLALNLPWPCAIDQERWRRMRESLADALSYLSYMATAHPSGVLQRIVDDALAEARRIAEGK